MNPIDWPSMASQWWPNFTISELECKCGCGGLPELKLMHALQRLRDRVAFPLPITSGFRCEEYDKSIGGAGVHPTGLAVDIGIGRAKAYEAIKWATHYGFTGIGDKGKGTSRFIHIDMLPITEEGSHPRPRKWTYNG